MPLSLRPAAALGHPVGFGATPALAVGFFPPFAAIFFEAAAWSFNALRGSSNTAVGANGGNVWIPKNPNIPMASVDDAEEPAEPIPDAGGATLATRTDAGWIGGDALNFIGGGHVGASAGRLAWASEAAGGEVAGLEPLALSGN